MIDIGGPIVAKRERVIQHCLNYSRQYAHRESGVADTLTAFTAPTPSPRNSNVWMNSVDFSSSPVWVYTLGVYTFAGRGCLVTPLHLVQAAHNGLEIGDGIGFLGNTGTAYSRTVDDFEDISPDMRVIKLNAALPSDVVPAKILPTPDTHFTSADFTAGIRSVMIGKFADLIARRWVGYGPGGDNLVGTYVMTLGETYANKDADIEKYSRDPLSPYNELESGDSGSANYIIINNQAVLIGTNFGNGLTSPHRQRAEFDAAITSLGSGGYSVSVVDLSGFVA
jgi:hypothetical protein